MDRKILLQRQSLSLEEKTNSSLIKIREFYNMLGGQVYVAFSGGLDSTVLLDLVRQVYPHVPGVFCDTGLEFPEIRSFVKSIKNVVWLKPRMSFFRVIEKYGYPVVSKEQSKYIEEYRNTKSDRIREIRWLGAGKNRLFKISEKWKFLVDAPFKISEKCCYVMKKAPSGCFEKSTGMRPFLGTLAEESNLRTLDYLRRGCNIFKGHIMSRPLGFWLGTDIWGYIKSNNVKYSEIYDKGETSTGCIFCLFGFPQDLDRFDRLKVIHPKLYRYCMDTLGLAKVIDFILMGLERQGVY